MKNRRITRQQLEEFEKYLLREEKSEATREKYLRDVKNFADFAGEAYVNREMVHRWKEMLQERYAVRSVNAMLASLNSLLSFLGWQDCKVKSLRFQRQSYCPEERELTRTEYFRLLQAAKRQEKLYLLLQTICATGIRVSELRYFTVETVTAGRSASAARARTGES